jgi:hypothetical protein
VFVFVRPHPPRHILTSELLDTPLGSQWKDSDIPHGLFQLESVGIIGVLAFLIILCSVGKEFTKRPPSSFGAKSKEFSLGLKDGRRAHLA